MSREGCNFFGLHDSFSPSCRGRGGARKKRRLLRLISVDGVPLDVRPSGAGVALGARRCCSLERPTKMMPQRGYIPTDGLSMSRCWGLRSGMLALQPDAVGWTALAMAEAKAAIAGRSPHYLVCVQASGHEVARSFA